MFVFKFIFGLFRIPYFLIKERRLLKIAQEYPKKHPLNSWSGDPKLGLSGSNAAYFNWLMIDVSEHRGNAPEILKLWRRITRYYKNVPWGYLPFELVWKEQQEQKRRYEVLKEAMEVLEKKERMQNEFD